MTSLPRTEPAAAPRPGPSPKIREVRFEDFPRIAALADQANFTLPRDYEEWRHLWANNPAYLKAGSEWPLGWAMEVGDRIVGYIGNIPTMYEFCGRTLLCGCGHSWVAEAQYRGHALFILDRYLRQARADLVMSNTANAPSSRVHMQLGAQNVPLGQWDRSFVWITRYSQVLQNWLGRKHVPAANWLAYPASLGLAAKDAKSRIVLMLRQGGGADVRRCAGFDERFDHFWDDLRARYQQKLLAFRDSSTLKWHFHYALRDGRAFVFTLHQSGHMQAYAVFVMPKRVAGDPIVRMNLADFQSLDAHQSSYCALLRAALKQAHESGIHLLSTNGFSASGIDTSSMAPYCNSLANFTFVYKAANPELANSLSNPHAWCPSLYDADASL